jgi:acyl-CoA synthetase (AMP-forming)/AMP-acid ligase II
LNTLAFCLAICRRLECLPSPYREDAWMRANVLVWPAGEPMPRELAARWGSARELAGGTAPPPPPPRTLLNTYGVTEATVYQLAGRVVVGVDHPVSPNSPNSSGRPPGHAAAAAAPEPLSAGEPLPGVRVMLVTASGAVVGAETECVDEDSELGEIWLGGPQLARGYLNAPALTARKFVHVGRERAAGGEDGGAAAPRLPAGRWFRTGDRGRWIKAAADGGGSGGESFPRVDWVAVPEDLRARRVNRWAEATAALAAGARGGAHGGVSAAGAHNGRSAQLTKTLARPRCWGVWTAR